MSVFAISIKGCFGGFGVCCSEFGDFIPFGEVYERVLHDGCELLDQQAQNYRAAKWTTSISNDCISRQLLMYAIYHLPKFVSSFSHTI